MTIELLLTTPDPISLNVQDYDILVSFLLPEIIQSEDGDFVESRPEKAQLGEIDDSSD